MGTAPLGAQHYGGVWGYGKAGKIPICLPQNAGLYYCTRRILLSDHEYLERGILKAQGDAQVDKSRSGTKSHVLS
jgi:hypothetical protein